MSAPAATLDRIAATSQCAEDASLLLTLFAPEDKARSLAEPAPSAATPEPSRHSPSAGHVPNLIPRFL